MGAGESQIVAPDGEVLAKASKDREEVVCADIDVLAADRKDRPDGSSLFAWRRPKLYAALAEDRLASSKATAVRSRSAAHWFSLPRLVLRRWPRRRQGLPKPSRMVPSWSLCRRCSSCRASKFPHLKPPPKHPPK